MSRCKVIIDRLTGQKFINCMLIGQWNLHESRKKSRFSKNVLNGQMDVLLGIIHILISHVSVDILKQIREKPILL